MFGNRFLGRFCRYRARSKIPGKFMSTATTKTNGDVLRKSSKWSRLRKHYNERILWTESALSSKSEIEDFIGHFPRIAGELCGESEYDEEPELRESLSKLLNCTVPTGKKNRGLAVVSSYKILQDADGITSETEKLANVLGWCVEMLHTSFLIKQDAINDAEIRRGVKSWHREKPNGFLDTYVLQEAAFGLLKRHFSDHPNYIPLHNLFNDTIMHTALGQVVENLTHPDMKLSLESYTMNNYLAIVKYKWAYYSFYLPIASAMYLAGNADEELHRQAKTILLEMGHFFRVQEDFLDCFGDKTISGRSGNDIKEGKCSWLVVVALQRATSRQKQTLMDNYGKNDVEAEEKVKKVYVELGLPTTYTIYEEKSYNIIKHHIQQLSAGLPHDVFLKFMEKLYRRDCELFLY